MAATRRIKYVGPLDAVTLAEVPGPIKRGDVVTVSSVLAGDPPGPWENLPGGQEWLCEDLDTGKRWRHPGSGLLAQDVNFVDAPAEAVKGGE